MDYIVGVDFGAKRAGTTAVAIASDSMFVRLISSEKKADADQFLFGLFVQFKPSIVAIDAPLSLPNKLINKSALGSYQYRKCDQELSAMSPMFLGGLTARAIELKDMLNEKGSKVIEAYPKKVAERVPVPENEYKKGSLEKCFELLKQQFSFSINEVPTTWHEFDALLALDVAQRFRIGKADSAGDESEGLIFY